MASPDESVVRDSLYNWLGFGNPNGRYWFIGREESISLSQCHAINDWTDYFEQRSEFSTVTDFRWTWEIAFGRPLTTFGATTWHYQIAFLLAFHGLPISGDRIRRLGFEDPQFARTFSDHFSGEFFPCPKKSKSTIEPYDHIWDSPESYHQEVAPGRIRAFIDLLEKNDAVTWIITYSPMFASHLKSKFKVETQHRWPNIAMDPFVLSEIHVSPDRMVFLLETPFLGYGRVSYDAIQHIVSDLQSMH